MGFKFNNEHHTDTLQIKVPPSLKALIDECAKQDLRKTSDWVRVILIEELMKRGYIGDH